MTNLLVSPAQAATELLNRRQARGSLIEFTTHTFPRYEVDPVHELLAGTLDDVVSGEIKRLMVLMPPQHGKSELCSVRLPAYWLGKRPDDPVALTSYAASLALAKSRNAREAVESETFNHLFPHVATRRYSRAVDHWSLAPPRRGNMWAGGVGGPITGHGFMLGIVDDPFENWEQAQSETMRNKVWDWWRQTFRTRIWEGGAIILVMTRWHEDDLAGRLLADPEQAHKWHVLRLPAIAETQEDRDESNRRLGLPKGEPDPLGREPGEPLAPQRFSLEALQELRVDVGTLGWQAEYQGSPRAPEGNRIKRGWLTHYVNSAPLNGIVARIRYWDKASTEGAGSFTAGTLLALHRDPDTKEESVFVEDVQRGQLSSHKRDKLIKEATQNDRATYGDVTTYIEQEPGSSGKDEVRRTIQMLMGFDARADRPSGDKDVRLKGFEAWAEAGKVFTVRGPWNQAWIDELAAIPNGAYRDQADATSGAFNKLPRKKRKAKSYQG